MMENICLEKVKQEKNYCYNFVGNGKIKDN